MGALGAVMLQHWYKCAIVIVGLSAVSLMRAQSSTGEIDVSVTDATEAAVMDARVTITGAETGATVRQLGTNAAGLAPVPLLNPGVYDIKVEKEGFKTLLRKGIVLRVTDVLARRVTLEVG